MARPSELIVDGTPLDGPRIDVPARIGWLLRTNRTVAGVSLRDIAARLQDTGRAVSLPMLSRLERNGGRNGAVVDGYEEALGLDCGALRAPVDALCRTFHYAPADEDAGLATEPSLERFDRTVEPILAGGGTGGEWLMFAREHERAEPFGLPSALMRPHLERLASEVGRAVGTAYTTRMEALARLRTGAYADLVDGVVCGRALEPGAQVIVDLSAAVAALPTRTLLDCAGEMLAMDSTLAVCGGVTAMATMASVGGLTREDWLSAVPKVAAAVRAADGDAVKQRCLAQLLMNLPKWFRVGVHELLGRPVETVQTPASWTASRRNAHWSFVERLAADVCARLDVPEQPLLTRLLFEVLYDFRVGRAMTSSYLLLGFPAGDVLREVVFEALRNPPDELTAEGLERLLLSVPMPWDGHDVAPLLHSERPAVARYGLVVAAQAGTVLPAGLVRDRLGDPELSWHALYAAGMARHPVLDSLAKTEHNSGAAWWNECGGRVTD